MLPDFASLNTNAYQYIDSIMGQVCSEITLPKSEKYGKYLYYIYMYRFTTDSRNLNNITFYQYV